ncbi:signal peptidase I [Spirulina subsalsa]|uniref:signal peptidase I n=1 Tax=Spirulina subsalsa TaxID=54311 RepID=UPI0003188B23|nr:signal peptidase I [Spirulina subsalsa]
MRQDPWLAINLSLFFPGIGQWYARKWLKGGIWVLAQVGLIAFSAWSIFAPYGNTVLGLSCFFLIAGVYIGNLFDAYYSVESDTTGEKIPRRVKNPWFAVFLSRVLPGVGQFYGDKVGWGAFFLGAFLLLSIFDQVFPSLLIISPLISAIAAYHAYQAFPRAKTTPQGRRWVAILAGVLFSLELLGNYFPLWLNQQVEMFVIPSGSMQPTLQVNDRILVRKSKNYQPQVGDIIVFEAPDFVKAMDPLSHPDDTVYYVKRVMGTPGQRIEVLNGVVYINNQAIAERYVTAPANYNIAAQRVPEDKYWVLGDRRNDSFDSHVWGFLPADLVIGQAYKIVFPPGRIQPL